MLRAADAARGYIVTAPHGLAAGAGLSVLREGGNAIEAMIAVAATIAVVYPHMNGLGGDGFWLIAAPGADPIGIDACGATGRGVCAALYGGLAAIPARGPMSANTVAGTVSGWQEALALSAEWGGRMSLDRLFKDAIHYAEAGFPASDNQARATAAKQAELAAVPGFAETFLIQGAAPAPGARFTNPALTGALRSLAADGLDGFYRGALARSIAAGLAAAGAPVTGDGLTAHRAQRLAPLALKLRSGAVYNLPPPTQGVSSLMILGLLDRLGIDEAEPDGLAHVHAVVEATKQAFLLRDAHIGDPETMDVDPARWLRPRFLDSRAPGRFGPRPGVAPGRPRRRYDLDGRDRRGRPCGELHPEPLLGVRLRRGPARDPAGLAESRLRHTLGRDWAQPARAPPPAVPYAEPAAHPARRRRNDGLWQHGRRKPAADPGGALFPHRHLRPRPAGRRQRAALAARADLERGDDRAQDRARFDPALLGALAAAGHDVEPVEPCSDLMGHAGAVIRCADGRPEGTADPRANGAVAGFQWFESFDSNHWFFYQWIDLSRY